MLKHPAADPTPAGASPPSEALAPATLGCERERIHTPGAVQPHGALLAARADDLRVSHASANLMAILGRSAMAVLGATLEQAIGAVACRALTEGVPEAGLGVDRSHRLDAPDGRVLQLRAHRSGRHLCVDIEPVPTEAPNRSPLVLAQRVLHSFEHASSAVELCELAVRGLKAITGYDRVMAYRFDAAGDGEVIAEAREAHLEPFLGLHYPASDIPPQARQLYLRQRVGMIGDSSYVPVPILVDPALDDGTPLDLTHSTVRSVSPVHCEYMRNMKTAASLTIGLAQGAALWGMLVCHHGTPRIGGPEMRAAAGTIGQVVSLLLQSLGDAEVLAQRLVRDGALRELVERIGSPEPLADALVAAPDELLRVVDATGAVVRFAGALRFVGRTPPSEPSARALVTLQALARGEVLAVEDLGRRHPELQACASLGSGALLLPLAPGSDDAILWFRPELSRTVTWAGNPAVHGSVDAVTARISPRASFQAWKETVTGCSAPWTEVDLALARELRSALQAEVVLRTRAALLESEARLGLLAEHSGVVVALTGLDGVRSYISPAAERVLGWRPEDMLGRSALDFAHPDDQALIQDGISALRRGCTQSVATYRFRRPDGSWLWVDAHASLRPGPDGGPAQDYVVVLRDASERKAAELKLMDALARMQQMAATDGLTGLANRRQLDVAADREWRRCARELRPLSVLLLDADNFKLFNDRYGHLAGDDCLRAMAARIAAAAQRPGDLAVRYGGEEFLLMLPNADRDGALATARRVREHLQALAVPHAANAGYGVMTLSVGVATAWPGDPACRYPDMSALIAAADAALYRAKAGGRNRVETDGDAAVTDPTV